MQLYQVRICDIQQNAEVCLYFSYPPSHHDILRHLRRQDIEPQVLQRLTCNALEQLVDFPALDPIDPARLHRTRSGYIEYSTIEIETDYPLHRRYQRYQTLYKERQRLIQQASGLLSEIQEINKEIIEDSIGFSSGSIERI